MKHSWLYRSVLIGFVLLACLSVIPARAQSDAPLVMVLTADGAVSPAMAEYLQRGIKIAEQRGADLIVLQLNTPGGAVDTMEQMKQDMLASTVPIVVYIQPAGAWAASAGTIITLAGHAAAMAPNTTIGAASPVSGEGQDLDSTSEAKVKSVMRATVRALAERRGPEAVALAEDTIENAVAVYADEALAVGLVDFIASDLDDLLRQLDGFTVMVAGNEVTLRTADAVTEPVDMSFIEQLLLVLTNPNVVFLLLSVGVQAILIEISSPGGWVAGFIGVVCIALATYGMGILPVNWFGIVFILTAFVLFIIDIKAPTHGGLTAAGIGSMIVGALVLFNSPATPSFQRVSVPLVIVTSLFTGALFFTILMVALRAQRAPIRTGQESIVGRVGMVRSEMNPSGSVHMAGELWSADLAEGEPPLPVGTQVRVVRVDGLRIVVERVGKERASVDPE
ncbi:MAG TPA: nodulation protein NfeD [Anaerolineales bacterium]|nr:nodulation protein NfeD [Anaerolineales bacterium]